jgi:hypothetical protein
VGGVDAREGRGVSLEDGGVELLEDLARAAELLDGEIAVFDAAVAEGLEAAIRSQHQPREQEGRLAPLRIGRLFSGHARCARVYAMRSSMVREEP